MKYAVKFMIHEDHKHEVGLYTGEKCGHMFKRKYTDDGYYELTWTLLFRSKSSACGFAEVLVKAVGEDRPGFYAEVYSEIGKRVLKVGKRLTCSTMKKERIRQKVGGTTTANGQLAPEPITIDQIAERLSVCLSNERKEIERHRGRMYSLRRRIRHPRRCARPGRPGRFFLSD